jgi:peptidoglycan/LPS O-acetylase OafA/YrhL
MSTSDNGKILGFNGLRAIAVSFVFIEHKAKVDQVDFGWLGVWLFFALSGFLIIGILHHRAALCDLERRRRGEEIKRFFYRRTIRIFPIYYLTLGTCAVLFAVGRMLGNGKITAIFVGGWHGFLLHALYLSDLFVGLSHKWPGIMSHLWTLSVEEQFYLIAGPLLLIVAARRHMLVCLVGFAVAVATHFALALGGADDILVHTFPINNFGVMLAGGLCFFAAQSPRDRMSGSLTCLVVPMAVLVLGVSRSLVFCSLPPVADATLDVAMMVCTALIVMWIAANQQSPAVRFLELGPIEYLGRVSYGFYLYHMFVPDLANGGKVAHLLHLPSDSFIVKVCGFLGSFAVSFLIAHLSWKYVETPIMRLKDRRRKWSDVRVGMDGIVAPDKT